jgi:hypothetical protein
MWAPTDGWAMPSWLAAMLKPPQSTTLLNTFRRRGLAEIIRVQLIAKEL